MQKLKKHIPVDAYGACGNLTCLPRLSRKCREEVIRQYKFYLALENTECDDYITEKTWANSLLQGVVPIVNGPRRRDYEELLPPNSFIYLGDFKSVKDLADYLRMLDSRPDLYVKFLEWQYKGTVESPPWSLQMFCPLIPTIEKVKRGELKRSLVRTSKYYNSCRKGQESKTEKNLLGDRWSPW